MRRAPRIPAFWWAALAVALARGLVACSRADELELELYSGSLAWALVHGLPLDPQQLPVIPHNRGSVVLGALLAPAFSVFGPRLWVIKALAVVLSAVTAGLLAWLMELRVSRRAGLASAALLAFLPPSYQMVDVLALGSHGDSLLFTALALALLLAAPERSAGVRPLGAAHAAAFGLAAGFAAFFSLQSLVAFPALLAVWWLQDRGFWRRPASLAALAAAALWILPARAMLGADEAALIVNQSASERFLPDGVLGALGKWARTFAVELPASWSFELHGGAAARWVLLAALTLGLLATLPRIARREPLAVFCVLYPALAAAAYAVSNFELKLEDNLDGMGSRYLMPMHPCMALWIAFGLERAARAPVLAALLGAVGAGLAGWLALLDPGLAARQPTVRGTELAFFHGHIEHAGGDDPAARLAWVERLEPDWPDWRPLVHRSICLPQAASLEAVRAQPPEVAPYLWAQLGRERAEQRPGALAALPLSADELRWVLRGAGTELMMKAVAQSARPQAERKPALFANLAVLTAELTAEQREALVEGLGFQLGLRLTAYQPILLRVLADTAHIPDQLADVFYRALGEGFRLRFLESDYRTPGELSIEALLPPRARAPFRAGLGRAGLAGLGRGGQGS